MQEAFQPVTEAQWRDAIVKELKGKDYDSLRQPTPEGILIEPFYMAGKDTPAVPSFPAVDWQIAAYVPVQDIKSAREEALDALQGGAEMVVYDLKGNDYHPSLLEGILQDAAPVYVIGAADEQAAIKGLQGMSAVLSHDLQEVVHTSDARIHYLVNMRTGAGNMVGELASGLSGAYAALEAFANAGVDPAIAAFRIHFHVSCGSRYLFEVCKLRALRWLWASLCGQYGVKDAVCPILAESNSQSFSAEDVHYNMLRNTAQVMAAILGGATAVYAHPHEQQGEYPGFGERMARNIQLLLRHESHLGEVLNTPDGSWFFDSVTAQLAELAWDQFSKG